MVYHLVQGLVQRGHQVDLFASGDSSTDARLHAIVNVATSYDEGVTSYLDKEYETRNTFNLYRQAGRYDILHGHWPTLAAYFSNFTDRPTVITYAYVERHLHAYYRAAFPRVHPVCISKAQARMLGEDLPIVYNGLDVESMPFGDKGEDFLLIVGRIAPNKGIAEAIEIARQAGERLVIVGHAPPQLPWSQAYYEERVKPYVDGDRVRHIEHLPNAEVQALCSRAKAFLFPLQWEEPFGLAVAEALAAGAPVVTYPRGAMPELVLDGENGYLVESPKEAVRALGSIETIARRACRASIARRFTLDRMVSSYETLYEQILREDGRAGG
jgi:glycosyltransferase involved in cell wall biosynthesis